MAGKRNTPRIFFILLASMSLSLIGAIGWLAYQRNLVHNVIIAAGAPRQDSYVLMQAVKTIVERNYPRIKITLHETGGTSDSLARLERGEAQMAPAQADVPPGHSARTVAVLFEDTFQLLAQKTSGIQKFTDLKQKRIALPKGGGQYQSFLYVAGHFGLSASEFTFVGENDDEAGLKFSTNEADALFRVRGLHNKLIAELAETGKVSFVPIDQVPAMHVSQPAYKPTVIPLGAYGGNPPLPVANLDTVAMERVLLARQDVPDSVIFDITEVLMDHRQELTAAIPDGEIYVRPLLSGLRKPDAGSGLQAGMHPGALAFYDRDRNSFVQSHPDLIAGFFIFCALIWLWIAAIRRFAEARQKHRAGEYRNTMMILMQEARLATSEIQLEPIRAELLTMLRAAFRDLSQDRISELSFQSIRGVWQIAFDMCRGHPTAHSNSNGTATDQEVGEFAAIAAARSDSGRRWWKPWSSASGLKTVIVK